MWPMCIFLASAMPGKVVGHHSSNGSHFTTSRTNATPLTTGCPGRLAPGSRLPPWGQWRRRGGSLQVPVSHADGGACVRGLRAGSAGRVSGGGRTAAAAQAAAGAGAGGQGAGAGGGAGGVCGAVLGGADAVSQSLQKLDVLCPLLGVSSQMLQIPMTTVLACLALRCSLGGRSRFHADQRTQGV